MNQLKVTQQQSIITLAAQGWSKRKIARELALDRATVRKYLAEVAAKSPTPHTGSDATSESNPITPHTGSVTADEAKSPTPHTGSVAHPGPASVCDPWSEQIQTAWQAGLSMQRIYQDLVAEHQFAGSYYAVRRFIRRRQGAAELPFRRMECAPGHELQVDFGQGAWVVESERRRKTHLFRCVLSYSRKGYSEAVWRQTAETFIRCLENAFRHFGGVTSTVVIDNLKAGVIQPDWFDPEINPKLEDFARHYGTAILAHWERTVADTRIHGTTRQQVGALFARDEQSALRALPAMVFPAFVEAPRTVHRDGYIEFQRAYYSVPPEYVGRQVWVRHEVRLVRIYNSRREQIALHAAADPGKFTTDPAHLHSRKRHIIERGVEHLLDQCRLLGPLTGTWAEAMHQARGPAGLRVMLGLLQLAGKYPSGALEKAAATATHHGAWRLRDLKRLLEQPANVVQLDFLETHPLIRSLDAYRLVPAETLVPEPPHL